MSSCALHDPCKLLSQSDKLHVVPSPIMQALYDGRRDDAFALASERTLDHFEAAALGDGERLRELIEADRSLARTTSDDGFTALHYAAYFGTADVARLLIAAGADVAAPATNAMKVQPLHSAAASRSTDTSRLLLGAGAPPDAQQTGGYTAMHEAALHGDEALVHLLLEHGGDPGVRNDDGRSAIDLARENGHTDIADQLEVRLSR
jgi:ankyrin repeat protein